MITRKDYRYVKCWTEDGSNIVLADFADGLQVDISVAREIVANRVDFTQGRRHYAIINMNNVREVSVAAREYLQREDAGLKNMLAAAFVGSTPVCELLSTIFIKTPKNFESRYFNDERKALEWIVEIKASHQVLNKQQ